MPSNTLELSGELSVGDVVVVRDDAGDETSWACMPTGWIRLPATPAFTNAL